MWTARRILKELADAPRRTAILAAFWRQADPTTRAAVQMQLARSMNFREETVRKMSPEKKAELFAARASFPEFEHYLEMALMLYHTIEKKEMLSAFLDLWGVPHEDGAIESDDYTPPDAEAVRAAVRTMSGRYEPQDIRIYLATAGLLMEGQWRDATWPVVEEMQVA